MATPTVNAEKDLTETDDRLILGLFVSLIFLGLATALVGYLAQGTNVLADNKATALILKILIGAVALIVITVLANFKALDILQDHAEGLMKGLTIFFLAIFPVFFTFFGIAALIYNPIAGIIVLVFLALPFWLLMFKLIWPAMKRRIEFSAQMVKVATTIVTNEPGMIGVGILQTLFTGIIMAFLAIMGFIIRYTLLYNNENSNIGLAVQIISLFVVYWVGFIINYYFDGVNIFMAYQRLKNKDPKIGQGFSRASKRLPAIAGYAAITAIFILLLKLAQFVIHLGETEEGGEGKSSGTSELTLSGLAWSLGSFIFKLGFFLIIGFLAFIYYLLTFFVLPVIIIRKKSLKESMKESMNLFEDRLWDILYSEMGLGWASFIMYSFTGVISLVVGGFYGYYAYNKSLLMAAVFGIGALIFAIILTGFIFRPVRLSTITILYTYATEGSQGLFMVPDELKEKIDELAEHPRVYRPNRRRRYW